MVPMIIIGMIIVGGGVIVASTPCPQNPAWPAWVVNRRLSTSAAGTRIPAAADARTVGLTASNFLGLSYALLMPAAVFSEFLFRRGEFGGGGLTLLANAALRS